MISVPDYVASAAKRGLEWNAQGKSGDGVTDKTLREAREMADGQVSEDKLRRMGPWFRRHRPDMDAPKNKPSNKDFPGAGAVAWALWGGPTSGDIMRTAEWAEGKVAQLDKEQSAKAIKLQEGQEDNFNLMPQITITDIDGTIIERGQPVDAVLEYIDELDFDVVVLTNRPESDRAKTEKDLADIELEYTKLIMNAGDAPAPEFKKVEVKKLLDAGYDPQVFIDNDEANRKAVGSLGVKTLDPADIIAQSNQEDGTMDAVANLAKYMTIEEQLVKAVADVSGITAERNELRATVEGLVAKENEATAKLVADLDVSSKKLADLEVAFNALSAEKAELLKEISELSAKQVSASVEAAKIASSVGVSPVELSPADESKEPAKAVNHLEHFLSLPVGAERSAYFAKHKNEIVRSI